MDVVCVTCDAFSWLMSDWLRFWCRAAQGTVLEDARLIIVANQKPIEAGNAEVVYLGPDRGWSNNMIRFLGGYKNDDPFLLMLDDYMVEPKGVSSGQFEDCYNTIDLHDHVGYIRLVPIPAPTLRWHNHRGNHPVIGRLDKHDHRSYCCSLQPALWRRDTMLRLLEPDLNPWRTEGRGSRRAANLRHTEFLATRRHVIRYRNLLKRGKKQEEVVRWMREVDNAYTA